MGEQQRKPRPNRRPGMTGIQPIWSGGRWKWRAVTRTGDGDRKRYGPLRTDQREAHRDYLGLRDAVEPPPAVIATLEDAIASAIALKRERGGASERSIEAVRSYARQLLSA